MKRPITESLASKKEAVEEVLDALGLTVCRDVKIGNPLQKGISGGQAKRTNIGIALMSSPRILFLDEPTSGLDSFTANEVMTVVKKLLRGGVTICATIHRCASDSHAGLHRASPDAAGHDQPHRLRLQPLRHADDAHPRPRRLLWSAGPAGH